MFWWVQLVAAVAFAKTALFDSRVRARKPLKCREKKKVSTHMHAFNGVFEVERLRLDRMCYLKYFIWWRGARAGKVRKTKKARGLHINYSRAARCLSKA